MKWIWRLVVFVIVLVGMAVVSILLLPAERIARIATAQLSTATGREVSITGDVGLTFWPVLGVRAEGLELGNADWADPEPMFQAARVAIGVDAVALLRREIRIINIEADSPTVRLQQRADGRANWQFSDTALGDGAPVPQTAPTETAPGRALSVERIKITNAAFLYDVEGSDPLVFNAVDLALDWPDPEGAADVTVSFQPASERVNVAADIDGFMNFLAGGTQTLRVEMATDAGNLSFNGKGSTAGAVDGALALNTGDTDGFLRALGAPGVDLPENLGRRVDMTTALTLTPDLNLSLRDLVVDLGANRISGAADIDLSDVPLINAQLDVGDLDLDMHSTPSQGGVATEGGGVSSGGAGSSNTGGWPTSSIDASGLAAFNGQIAISANSIDLGQFELGASRALLRNDRSRMVFDLSDVQAYGGALTGEFVINNRAGLSVGGALNATGIEMQPLLKDAADFNRLTGKGNVNLSFLGSGGSVDAIMRSLSGKGSLAVGRGTILGIDLDRLMRSGDMGEGTTVFDSLGGTWTIAAGVLRNTDLLLQLKNYRASGAGVVGLGTQTLDYTATPVALRANSGRGLSIPVRFVGPWTDVSIRPDLEAAFDAEIDTKTDELANKAKEKLSKELGIAKKDGQSTEDAVKEELKNRLLKKLFD